MYEHRDADRVKAKYHSCGDINPFLPDLIEIGIDGLHPLEVKAGMDPVAVKHAYGGSLVLHGGVDARLWEDEARMENYVRRLLPVMKAGGGYIFSTDHTIPESAPLAAFGRIVNLARELGRY
jgi:uroporphyrinogen decarboxylase